MGKRYMILIILTGFLLTGFKIDNVHTQVCNEDKTQSELDDFFGSQLDSTNLAAISVAIIKGDKIAWCKAYGFRNIEKMEIAESNSVFNMGSLSKTITVCAFLNLCEYKNIELEEDINKYLPFYVRNPDHPSAKITFEMLLTHTSSLNDVLIDQGNNKTSFLYGPKDRAAELGSVLKDLLTEDGAYYKRDIFLHEKPGTCYHYSNVAFSLLGLIVEYQSGITFNDYCRANLFRPLKMVETTFLLSEINLSNYAYTYYRSAEDPFKLIKSEPFTWPGYMDGSLQTSAIEYSNFLIMMINNGEFEGKQVLSENVINTILEIRDLPGEQTGRSFKPAGRGIVWNRVNVADINIYHMNGFGPGFFTEAYFSPEEKMAGLFFTTGGFTSFVTMGNFVNEVMVRLIETSRKLDRTK
jgi:CubicO group peptidase (beta-lactamase class C family)